MSEDREHSPAPGNPPTGFGEQVVCSPMFRELFREGMALIEDTATYLDGDGRVESRALTRSAATAYTATAMGLTTRLMQLASWLLLQRAVNDGEISSERARLEKAKVRASPHPLPAEMLDWESLPEKLRALVIRSLRLQARAQRLDRRVATVAGNGEVNPIALQRRRIADAFAIR